MASVRSKVKRKPEVDPVDTIAELVERGISGTTNWYGDPYSEPNQKLQGASAYGQAGTRTWGEWEKIGKTDPDVASVLQFASAPIRASHVDVVPAEHPSIKPAIAEAQVEFVRSQLESVEPSWPEILCQGVEGALLSGFALHEVVLGLGEHPSLPGGEGYILKRLAERLPVSVHPVNGWREVIRPDGGRDLDYVQQTGQVGLMGFENDVRLPADKILLWTWKRSGQNYRGVSAFRSVWYIAKIREQLLKLIGITLTREGAGIPVATADKDADILTPGQQRKLERLLANLVAHENASVVMPRGWKMDWIFSGGGNKGHVMDIYNALGQLILRQLGAQQITLGSGDTGSRSVGEVHDAVAQGYLQSIIEMAHGVLNGCGDRRYVGLSRKLIEPNWGAMPAYPRIVLTLTKASLSPKERVEAMATASSAGLIQVTSDDENQLRAELGMSPRLEDEEVVETGTDEKEDGETDDLEPEEAPKGVSKASRRPVEHRHGKRCACRKALARSAEWTPWRALRPAEQRVDLAKVDEFLTDQRDAFQTIAKPIVTAMLAKAAPAITAAMADGDPSEIGSMPMDTKALDAAVGEWLSALKDRGARDVAAELGRQERKPEALTLGAVAIRPNAVMQAQRKSVVRRIVGRLQAWVEREAIDVLRTGGDSSEVVSGVMVDVMDSNALRTDAGTVIAKAYNVGRAEAAEELGAKRAEYSAILDSGTCQQCLAMDGRAFDIDSDEYEQAMPPNRDCDGGDNCRCFMVYIAGET